MIGGNAWRTWKAGMDWGRDYLNGRGDIAERGIEAIAGL